MKNENRATVGEAIVIYLVLTALVLVAAFLGFQEIISCIILPALLAYSMLRFGFLHALLQSALILVAYSLLSGGYYEPAWLTILPGICIGNCIANRRGLLYTVSVGAISLLAGELYIYFGNAIREDVQIGFLESMTYQSSELIQSMGLPANESALILDLVQTYSPAILLLSLAMLSYAIVFVLFLCLKRRMPVCVGSYPRFRDLAVSRGSMLLLIVAWIISFVGDGVMHLVFANLATIISCYVIVCGYSVVVYKICNFRAVGWRILCFIVLIWFGSVISLFAFVIGALDSILHFRKRGGDRI